MKVKKVLSLLLATGLVASSAAYAGKALTLASHVTDPAVHMSSISNNGSRDVFTKFVIYMGTMSGNVCTGKVSEAPFYRTLKANTDYVLSINGDVLRDEFGLNWDCGLVQITTDKQTTLNAYRIFNDGYTYTNSSPYSDSVTIN